MKQSDKDLYDKVKNKTRQQIKRRVRNVFTDYHKGLKKYSSKDQTLLGDFMTCLEMDVKKVI